MICKFTKTIIMKFTLDTSSKRITLVEDCSFKELEKIKKFVGKDFGNWKISVDTQYIAQYIDRWHTRPVFQPFIDPYPIWGTCVKDSTNPAPNILFCDTKTQAGNNELPTFTLNN